MPRQATFEGVEGYKTYASAVKRGEEIAAARSRIDYRWVVVALPSGRYAPLAIINDRVPGGPGPFLGERNLCMCN